MFASHLSAALEYWFFKVNAGPIALLVDWIERRKLKQHWMRVSIHSPYKREVIFEKVGEFMPGDNYLSPHKTTGHTGEIAWELEINPGQDLIQPDIFPIGLFKMIDTTILSAPLARFSGWIRHGSQHTTLDSLPGLISQYWGRQLSPEWWWVSANQFDQEGIAVECTVARASLWGTSVKLPLAYFYLNQPGRRELLIAPLSPIHLTGSLEKFEIEIHPSCREIITLLATGREYGDFGERIMNTLVGDLEIRQGERVIARANGTAALERRTPPAIAPGAK